MALRLDTALSPDDLGMLLGSTPNVVVMLDPDGRIVDANERFGAILGIDLEDVRHRAFAELVDPEDQPRTNAALEELNESASVTGLLNRIGGADGPGRWFRWWGWRSASGEHTVLVGSHETPLHQAAKQLAMREARLEFLLEELHRLVDEHRTNLAGEIHDGVLQELAAVAIELDSVALDTGDDVAARAVEGVRRASGQLRMVLERIVPIHLDEQTIERALEWLVQHAANGSGVEVKLEVDDAPLELPIELRALVWRLVSEAVDNSLRHAAASRVTVGVRRAGDGTFEVAVVDDGRGMESPEEALRPGPGRVGLGLLQERVHAFGGEVEVRSAPGAGTAMCFRLPERVDPLDDEVRAGSSALAVGDRRAPADWTR